MKKFAIVFITLLFCQITASSQPCLPDGIEFTTQAQIDSFQTNYPGCTEIEGYVLIEGDDITNLNGLSVLTAIGGSLGIGNHTALENLTGLDNVTTIGGDLFFSNNYYLTSLNGLNNLDSIGGGLGFSAIESLPNLTGLNNLTFIGGDLLLIYAWSITSLEGLENVNYIGGSVNILETALINLNGLENITSIPDNLKIGWYDTPSGGGNPSLTSLSGLQNLIYIGGYISIENNPNLETLIGLDNLISIGGSLNISGNHSLTSLSGLENLIYIGGGLEISGCDPLVSLTGLDGLDYIGGYINIWGNPVLTDIMSLNNLNTDSIIHLAIIGNSSLSSCEIQSICDYLSDPNGPVDIYNNDVGCNNPTEVANTCGITLSCLPYGNYHFLNQSDIDNFQTYYPGCTQLEGSVDIFGNDIVNLNGLSVVTSIGGSLKINDNNFLTDLNELENITSIDGGLMLAGNDSLTNLDGLGNITSLGGSLIIGDDFWYNGGTGNSSLTDLTGLENITSIDGLLMIGGNDILASLEGLENIDGESIEQLIICKNDYLSICEIKSICDYFVNPPNIAAIFWNAPGCNSQQEIEEACEVVYIDEKSKSTIAVIYPNPFKTSTTIEFELTKPTNVNISVFNHLGQIVETIDQGNTQQGKHQLVWDASGLPNGIYFVQVRAGNELGIRKMIKD